MKKALKIALKAFLMILVAVGIYLNFVIYYQPSFKAIQGGSYNESVYQQLQFLKTEMHNDADEEMQALFPEGFVFINALYALTWSNLIQSTASESSIHQEDIKEIKWTIDQIETPKAKKIFDEQLAVPYGVFYTGWSNLVLGNYLKLIPASQREKQDIITFKSKCQSISQALQSSKTPYLESYYENSWPADMTIAMASLKIHDQIFQPKYERTIATWISQVKEKLDPETALIPHYTHSQSGEHILGARGSSQSLILNFLFEIDNEFAKAQFQIYDSLFLDSRMGLPGIREYPRGVTGGSDVDSGPVIFGIGGAASIVGQRTMYKYGKLEAYLGLRNSIEGFGAAYTANSQKKYIFGLLPMADVFIAWSNSIEREAIQTTNHSNWRLQFQIISFILIIIVGFIILKL